MNEEEMGMEEGMETGEAAAGGYCIEIRVDANGGMSVSSEPLEEEEAGEPKGHQVGSIGEAVKLVMDIHENGGDAGASDRDFEAGYAPTMREGE